MSIVSNIIYAITDIHSSLQVTQSVVALRVLPKSKCFWYNLIIHRSCWATLILATKLLYTYLKTVENTLQNRRSWKCNFFTP